MQTRHRVILVADDNDTVRELVWRCLDAQNYVVLLAADGLEALQVAEAHPGTIDLLLSDTEMPKLNGLELARQLKRSRPNVQVIIMSAYQSSLDPAY